MHPAMKGIQQMMWIRGLSICLLSATMLPSQPLMPPAPLQNSTVIAVPQSGIDVYPQPSYLVTPQHVVVSGGWLAVASRQGDWYEVLMPNGQTGWVRYQTSAPAARSQVAGVRPEPNEGNSISCGYETGEYAAALGGTVLCASAGLCLMLLSANWSSADQYSHVYKSPGSSVPPGVQQTVACGGALAMLLTPLAATTGAYLAAPAGESGSILLGTSAGLMAMLVGGALGSGLDQIMDFPGPGPLTIACGALGCAAGAVVGYNYNLNPTYRIGASTFQLEPPRFAIWDQSRPGGPGNAQEPVWNLSLVNVRF
jgi:hypothetical protein